MKIVNLIAENVKKISAVEITPTENLVQITGRNGQGKSSVLDAIWYALAGTKNIPSRPIRTGQKSARIRLDLGEIVVTRKMSENGTTTLNVETSAGARFPSPQGMLDDLLGTLTFDPLAFSRMDGKAQYEQLRRTVKLDVDIDELDALNRGDFARRTEANREAEKLRATLSTHKPVAEDLPAEPVNTAELAQLIADAGVANGQLEARKARREQAAKDIETALATAARDADRAKELFAEADRLITAAQVKDVDVVAQVVHVAELQRKLDEAPALPTLVDISEMQEQLAAAAATNTEIARRTRIEDLRVAAEAEEKKSADLTAAMSERAKKKREAIAAAKMPVPGITLGEGEVLLNGVPLDQASSAEQLRLSCAIAMASNPKLRVLRIKDGSLLDDDGLKALAEMADTNDFQIWIERVDTSGKIGIVLEDGHLLGAAPSVAAE